MDATAERARVARNIRKWWPTLTDHDIQALSTWRWYPHMGHGPEDKTGFSVRRSGRRAFMVRQVVGTCGTRSALEETRLYNLTLERSKISKMPKQAVRRRGG